jgi:hypothetical protein
MHSTSFLAYSTVRFTEYAAGGTNSVFYFDTDRIGAWTGRTAADGIATPHVSDTAGGAAGCVDATSIDGHTGTGAGVAPTDGAHGSGGGGRACGAAAAGHGDHEAAATGHGVLAPAAAGHGALAPAAAGDAVFRAAAATGHEGQGAAEAGRGAHGDGDYGSGTVAPLQRRATRGTAADLDGAASTGGRSRRAGEELLPT